MTHPLLIKGDCLEVLPHISNECIDLIITDPPYGTNYGKVEGDESTEIVGDWKYLTK